MCGLWALCAVFSCCFHVYFVCKWSLRHMLPLSHVLLCVFAVSAKLFSQLLWLLVLLCFGRWLNSQLGVIMCVCFLLFWSYILEYPFASVRAHIYPSLIILAPLLSSQSHAQHTGNFPGHTHTKHTYLHTSLPPSTLFDRFPTPTRPYAPYAPLYTHRQP